MSSFAAPAAIKPALLPHRAVYDISLLPLAGRNRVSSASGRLVYEFSGNACEGYTTQTEFHSIFQTDDAAPQTNGMQSSTHEDVGGTRFSFQTSASANGQEREQALGRAERATAALHINLRMPAKKTVEAAGLVLFPTQHMLRAMKAADDGEQIFTADLFDGSENGEKIFATTAVLRKPISTPLAPGHPLAASPTFTALRRYPMSVAFFDRADTTGGEQKPLYTQTVEIFENGVTGAMAIDYGDFAVRGVLSKFEELPQHSCEK